MSGKLVSKPIKKPQYAVVADRKLTKGQLAYEQERAKKAGKSLDEWLNAKAKAEAAEIKKAAPKPMKKPGLLSRLLDRAHKPL